MRQLARVFLLIVATLVATACASIGPTVVGSGHVVTEQREVGAFTRVRVGEAIRATVTVGTAISVTVTADDNLLANIRTDASGGKLDVSITASGGGRNGQSGAARMGIARALVVYDAETFPAMRDNAFLTRDSRMKERKKYGLRGARRGVQFSKR